MIHFKTQYHTYRFVLQCCAPIQSPPIEHLQAVPHPLVVWEVDPIGITSDNNYVASTEYIHSPYHSSLAHTI